MSRDYYKEHPEEILTDLKKLFAEYATRCPTSQRNEPYPGFSTIIEASDVQAEAVNDNFSVVNINTLDKSFYLAFNHINMRTRPVVILKDVFLKIKFVEWGFIDVKFLQKQINYKGETTIKKLVHPHISGDEACWGTFKNEFITMTQQHYGKFPEIIALTGFCISFLRKYNVNSCYNTRETMLRGTSPMYSNPALPNQKEYYFGSYSDTAREILTSVRSSQRESISEGFYKHIDAIRERYKELGVSDKLMGNGEPQLLWIYLREAFRDIMTASMLSSRNISDNIIYNNGSLPTNHPSKVILSEEDIIELKDQIYKLDWSIPSSPYASCIKYLEFDYSWIDLSEHSGSLIVIKLDLIAEIGMKARAKFLKDFKVVSDAHKETLSIMEHKINVKYLDELNKRRERVINELVKSKHTTDDERQGSLFATEVS